MSWDASRDRDSGRPRRTEDPKVRGSRRPNPSNRPPPGLISQNPRSRSLRAREKAGTGGQTLPVVVEEELWFGGQDASIAEDTAARSMAALVGRIVGAKPFPESARRLANLTGKDVVRIEPIVQVLERDPALSVRLLRLVNSAGYALRQRCTSVRHAATLVGTDRLHQIATTAAVLDLFDSRSSMAARIIEHCTIVGAFCRYFGAHLALPVDDLFTAGFLHDIGKLMLLETEGDQYVELLEKYANQPGAIHVAERSIYGFDHAVLAAHVLNAWNIPDPVPKIVAWHHNPTRAYRISGMMAALVQTVRLADAAVCAMVSGVTQEEFSKLATAESASYLDISEPQLASMWDELQTLYHESIEQCRGDNAPALDPRSLRPKQPLSMTAPQNLTRSTELPLQFPCVVCGGPTFGNTCCACGGHMCPEHQVGREDWCTFCARDYHSDESEAPAAVSPRLAVLIGLATVVISAAIGYETGGAIGGVRAGIGTCLLLALALVLAVVGRRLLLRFRFVRTRPNRKIVEALENDGGVQSLVPRTADESMSSSDTQREPLSEHTRLSGTMVERVMIRDVPSIPAIIAPRPFDGLASSSLLTSPPPNGGFAFENPTAPVSSRRSFDADRLAMQSVSLVTLPAPAHFQDGDHGNHDASDGPPHNGQKSHAHDTSLGPIQPSPIEVPKTALVPNSPSTVGLTSGPYESGSPERDVANSEVEAPPLAPMVSTHPLAVLGLRPERTAERPTQHSGQPGPGPEAAAEPVRTSTTDRLERTTLVGLTAHADADAEPEPVAPSREIAELAAEALVPLTQFLKSEPPVALEAAADITAPILEDLIQPLANALGPEILSKIDPDFQAKVMELVAQRVAAALAEQMLQSFGQAAAPPVRPKPSRVPLAKGNDSEAPEVGAPAKRRRRRVAKH